MLGAIAGDIIGSVHEFNGTKTMQFELFPPQANYTDDSVLAIATADILLHGGDYADAYRDWALSFPQAGYGGMFAKWIHSGRGTPAYNSFGNGSAMRVPPIGFYFNDIEEVLAEAKRSAEVTHNHPEGIKGAQATAAAIFLARSGKSKEQIRKFIERHFAYDMERSLDRIRPRYRFDESCQGTVPEAIIAFLESEDWEDAVRKSISLGGDADTLACITGAIAEAFYGTVPEGIAMMAKAVLPKKMLNILEEFETRIRNK